MARLPLPPLLGVLTLSLFSTTLASAIPALHQLGSRDTCAAKGYDQCSGISGGDFCCPSGNKCIPLAGNTTVLCCPDGSSSNCSKIQPITCNLDDLDAEKHPEAPVKTNVFDVQLPRCGDSCCPFGYSCTDQKQCEKNADQSKPPQGHKASATSSAPTKTASSTSTGTSVPTSTVTHDESEKDDVTRTFGPDIGSIIGGVVGGCVILIIAAIIIFICVRRRARQKAENLEKPDQRRGRTPNSGYSNIISDPIVQPNQYRADFIRRQPSTSSNHSHSQTKRMSVATRASKVMSRGPIPRISIPNPFNSPNPSVAPSHRSSIVSRDSMVPRHGEVTGARLAPIRSMKASSRYLKPHHTSVHRQPSAESINIFADPKTVDRQTTFTELLDEADLAGVGSKRPYVPGTTPRI